MTTWTPDHIRKLLADLGRRYGLDGSAPISQLANILRTPERTVHRWLNGQSNPSREYQIRLNDAAEYAATEYRRAGTLFDTLKARSGSVYTSISGSERPGVYLVSVYNPKSGNPSIRLVDDDLHPEPFREDDEPYPTTGLTVFRRNKWNRPDALDESILSYIHPNDLGQYAKWVKEHL